VLCDVTGALPDVATVDALARLVVAGRRQGYRVRLCNASPELADLIELMGLTRALLQASVEPGR